MGLISLEENHQRKHRRYRIRWCALLAFAFPWTAWTQDGSGGSPDVPILPKPEAIAPNAGLKQPGVQWKPLLNQSLRFLVFENAYRYATEPGTRDPNRPYFRGYLDAVGSLHGWADGDPFYVNYVGHPMQGAVTGRIFINNSDKARRQEFGKQGHYWESRVKTMAWSALWSLQFELGPISETSIGNVGKTRAGDGRSKQTYGDIVVTPLVGTGLVVLEDMVDKYVLDHWLEQRFTNSLMIKITRSLLTPSTSFGNILRGRAPWRRDYRFN